MVPRFYYTLPIKRYFLSSFLHKSRFFSQETLFFNTARTALRLLLNSISDKQLKIGVQAYTCHTVFQAIHNAGHTPVFIDLTNELKLDINDLKRKIEDIDVLIVTHTFGFPEDIDEIKKIVGNKIVIEDCAHSFLSKYKGKYTGTFGDAAIFSTGLGKFPPIGSGGFCVVNKPDKFPFLEKEYAKIPKSKLISSIKDFLKVLVFSFMMKPPLYGALTYKIGKSLDSKLDFGNKFSFLETTSNKWTKTIFKNNLNVFKMMLAKQTENANVLSSIIKMKNFVLTKNKTYIPNYYAFPLLTDNRNKLYDKLLENNIETGKHFHKSIIWATEFGYKKGECPNTERIVEKIIVIPTHLGVKKNNLLKIASILNNNK